MTRAPGANGDAPETARAKPHALIVIVDQLPAARVPAASVLADSVRCRTAGRGRP